MRLAILGEIEENSSAVDAFLSDSYPSWKIYHYKTDFSFVTAIYDEYKGDVDCMVVFISGRNTDRILMVKDIQDFFPHIKLIFYSYSSDFADVIFKAFPSYFLKLPYQTVELAEAFKRVSDEVRSDMSNSMVVHIKGNYFRIRYESIGYIESSGRKMIINTTSGIYETYMKVEETMEMLPEQFFRCHRSYIVNVDMIKSFETDGVYLLKNEFVPVSRVNIKEMRELIARNKKC